MKRQSLFYFVVIFIANLFFVAVSNAEDIVKLVSKLNSDNFTEQVEAHEKLLQLKDLRSIPLLIDICRNEEARGYVMASDLLAKMDELAIDPLINAMVDDQKNWSNFSVPLQKIGKPAVAPLAIMLDKEAKQIKNISDKALHYVNFLHILTCLQGIGSYSVPYLEKFVKTCDNNDLKEAVKFAVDFIKSTSR